MEDTSVKAFERLTRDQAERLADLLDESILYTAPSLDAMREAVGSDFGDDDLYELATLYASFMHGPDDATWREAADRTGLPAAKRQLYAEIAERVNGKADADKVEEYSALSTAIFSGYPHIYDINIFTEFRPVSGKKGIAHLVPYLVIDGTAHGLSDGAEHQIKMQLDPIIAKNLAKDIKSGLKVLNAQIAEMREKFGDDVVHG